MPREKNWDILGNDRISYTISNMLYIGCMNPPELADQLYLEQPGSAGEGLEAGADGGEERADLDDLGVRPRDVAHHQTPPDALAKPG